MVVAKSTEGPKNAACPLDTRRVQGVTVPERRSLGAGACWREGRGGRWSVAGLLFWSLVTGHRPLVPLAPAPLLRYSEPENLREVLRIMLGRIAEIADGVAREILDSRGNPTVEVEL